MEQLAQPNPNESITDDLVGYLEHLDTEAQSSRIWASTSKLINLATVGMGLISSLTVPFAWGVSLVGGSVYLAILVRESRKTGRTMLIPFSEMGLGTICRGISQTEGFTEGDLLDYHYLTAREKSDYVLLSVCAEEIGAFMDKIPERQRKRIWKQASNRFHRQYSQVVRDNPDVIAAFSDKRELLKFLLATPEEMRQIQLEAQRQAAQIVSEANQTDDETATLSRVGNPTRLGLSPAGPTLDATVSTGHSQSSQTTAGIQAGVKRSEIMTTLFANGRINPDFLARSQRERAQFILEALRSDGCDIAQFVGDQLLGATGTQRSGKTTLLMILSILEMALNGKEIHYLTVDDDLYPVTFTSAVSGMDRGIEGYEKFLRKLAGLKKGEARNLIWFLDECTKTLNLMGKAAKESLWNGLLTGFIKSGGSVRLVTHGTTAPTMGIPDGYVAQVKDEATFVKALRKRDDGTGDFDGSGKYPSGKYLGLEVQGVSYEPTGERFAIPGWLLFDNNEDGAPCYVCSLLRFFPELDTRCSRRAGVSMAKEAGQTSMMLDADVGAPGSASPLSTIPDLNQSIHSTAKLKIISDAFDDLFEKDYSGNSGLTTDWIDSHIETLKQRRNNRAECMAELLELIRQEALDGKTELRRGQLTTSSWASKWKKRGSEFRDCSGQEFNRFVDTAIKAGFLSTEDDKTYLIKVS